MVKALATISDGHGLSEEELMDKLIGIIVAKTGLSIDEIKRVVREVEIGV